MYQRGSLLFIENFDFSSINLKFKPLESLRNKYVLILDVKENSEILCCFTTRLEDFKLYHKTAKTGCDKKTFPYNVFHFNQNSVHHCDDTKFKFPTLTFIAGNKGQVFPFDGKILDSVYKNKGKIQHKGILPEQLLFDIIQCLHLSKTLVEELKDYLFEIGNGIMINIQKKKGQA